MFFITESGDLSIFPTYSPSYSPPSFSLAHFRCTQHSLTHSLTYILTYIPTQAIEQRRNKNMTIFPLTRASRPSRGQALLHCF